MPRILLAAALASSLWACSTPSSMNAGAPARVQGGVLTDSRGMTLYVFDKDPGDASKSVCNGSCATNWPPFVAGDNATPAAGWSLVSRDDGQRQWAYKGKPLYTWSKDHKPGDMSGDGFNQVWHSARP